MDFESSNDSSEGDPADHIPINDLGYESVTENDEEYKKFDEKRLRRLKPVEVNTFINTPNLNKMCCIYFYYTENVLDKKYCTECFIEIADMFRAVYVIRKHITRRYAFISGKNCGNCRKPLYQILPCNMCPICRE